MKKVILAYMLIWSSAHAELRLNELFKDNMVLQRDAAVAVYGRAAPESRVTVTPFFGVSKDSAYMYMFSAALLAR